MWDEDKRQKVLDERELDFADAVEIFYDPAIVIIVDDRCPYRSPDGKIE